MPVYRIPFAAVVLPGGDYMEHDVRIDQRPPRVEARGRGLRVRQSSIAIASLR